VLAECAEWSLSLPLTDVAIYADMTPAERGRRRRAFLSRTG
jgi:hypothetical protein